MFLLLETISSSHFHIHWCQIEANRTYLCLTVYLYEKYSIFNLKKKQLYKMSFCCKQYYEHYLFTIKVI